MSIQQDLEGLGFERGRVQDGLEDSKVVSYTRGEIVLEVYMWSDDDWDVGPAYGPRNALQSIQPELLRLIQRTPARQRRIAFRTGKPPEASDG